MHQTDVSLENNIEKYVCIRYNARTTNSQQGIWSHERGLGDWTLNECFYYNKC